MNAEQITIPYPPGNVFRHERNIHAPAQEVIRPQAMFILEDVKYPETGGIFAYFKGCPFPQKGFPFPEALYAVNAVKRITIEAIKSIGKSDMLALLGFALTPKKYKIKSLEAKMSAYVNGSNMFLNPYYLNERYYSSFCREMRKFIITFWVTYGINEAIATNFADVLTTLVDYDNAYRLRAEDIFSETTKDTLKSPQKEIKRLIGILGQREPAKQNTDKFQAIAGILGVLLWLPSFKKCYKKAWQGIEMENLQLDEADRHHVLLWADYNFLGKTIEERIKMYIDYYGGEDKLPPRIMANPQ